MQNRREASDNRRFGLTDATSGLLQIDTPEIKRNEA
jgi:hypothetical protein